MSTARPLARTRATTLRIRLTHNVADALERHVLGPVADHYEPEDPAHENRMVERVWAGLRYTTSTAWLELDLDDSEGRNAARWLRTRLGILVDPLLSPRAGEVVVYRGPLERIAETVTKALRDRGER